MIHRIIIACLFCSCLLATTARAQQQQQQPGSITIGVVVPEQEEYINGRAFNLLKTKLESMMLANGVASMMNGGFVMYPVVNIVNTEVVEGGMKNITIVNADISLYITQLSTGIAFGNTTKSLKGSGTSTQEAIKNAFTKLSPSDKECSAFIAAGKKSITDYYEKNLQLIISKANTLAASKQYEEALAWLMSYPESLQGYDKVAAASVIIYKQYQNAMCSQLMQEAKAAYSMNDYQGTIDCLNRIDAESRCGKEAVALMAQVRTALNKENAEERRMMEKEMDASISLEKQRINAIKEVAKAYYSNSPVIHYTQIVK